MSKSKSQKAAKTKASASVSPGRPTVGSAATHCGAMLAILPLVTLACQLALHPLYGSVTTSLNFSNVTLAASLLPALLPIVPERFALLTIGIVLAVAPSTALRLGSLTSRWRDPVWGPVVTQLGLAAPIVFLSASLTHGWILPHLSFTKIPSLALKPAISLGLWASLRVTEPLWWNNLSFGGELNSCNIFLGLSMLFTALSGISTRHYVAHSGIASKYAPFVILPLLAPLFLVYNSNGRLPCTTPALPWSADNNTLSILARADSTTGVILVGESRNESFRYLRADHSLLGGVWVGERAFGAEHGDSIYTAFVLQEAIRLAERPTKPTKESALVIGLGAGIAAKAFKQHGINTTVVEIDPIVYEYARKYFGLPQPDSVYLEDARGWVAKRAKTLRAAREAGSSIAENELFDHVVHDCFSGGGVPAHIFTMEFWTDLKELVREGGIVGVNFAGKLGSDASRAILLTLLRSFNECRAFHDRMDEKDDEETFLNMVFFCSTSPPLKFRPARHSDYLNSYLRQAVLSSLSKREVSQERILGTQEKPIEWDEPWILRDSHNRLGEWQKESAVEHWEVMRQVLPDIVWETY